MTWQTVMAGPCFQFQLTFLNMTNALSFVGPALSWPIGPCHLPTPSGLSQNPANTLAPFGKMMLQ